MTTYVLLIMEAHGQRADRNEAEGQACWERMLAFTGSLQARGMLRASESLLTSATRIAATGGKPRMIDGPFAEAKEMVGGFFLIDCQSRDEALAIAAQCPAAEWATVELRETGPCFYA